jgi:hypothetical protein
MPIILRYDGWAIITFTGEVCRVSIFHFCTCALNSIVRSAAGALLLDLCTVCRGRRNDLSNFELLERLPCRAILGLTICGIAALTLTIQHLIDLIAQTD